jgi:cobaltochelatase CobN
MNNLIRGLNGEYVPGGEGNDPLRNLAAIPTGRNFYAFPGQGTLQGGLGHRQARCRGNDPAKRDKEGHFPEKVGVVLWATETNRNEGVHEATILWLMGVEPIWDASDRVVGSRVVPGNQLGRPRIDVLINPSGLYRDMYPEKLLFLDEAVQKALAQTDIENFLARNQVTIKKALLVKGMDEKEAEEQSRFRIFTEAVGSYGNGVEEMVGASGLWDSDESISNVYLNRVQFAVGRGKWAVPSRPPSPRICAGGYGGSFALQQRDRHHRYRRLLHVPRRHVPGGEKCARPGPGYPGHHASQEGRTGGGGCGQTIGREMRTRYLNPQWIEGMKRDNYGGAPQMADFAENLWVGR